jgi:hypothetical protein
MNDIVRIRVRHAAPSLWDSDSTTAIFPTLKRGANQHCAYGAQHLLPKYCARALGRTRFVPSLPLSKPNRGTQANRTNYDSGSPTHVSSSTDAPCLAFETWKARPQQLPAALPPHALLSPCPARPAHSA